MDEIRSFRDLEAWQLGMELAERVHGATAAFPDEGGEIAARMRDASVSIPATVSEAFALECGERLLSAVGPLAEVETCVELGKRLGFLAADLADDLHARIEGVAQAVGRLLEAVGGQGDREEGDYPGRPLDDERGYLHDEGCCEPPRRHPHHGEGCCEPPRRHRHHGEGCCEPPRRHRHHGEGCCEPPRRRR